MNGRRKLSVRMQQLVLILLLLIGVYLERAYTVSIFCEFRDASTFEVLYTCKATKANPCENKSCSNIVEVLGKHELGKSNADVKAFVMENQQIAILPTNLASWFPNLRYVSLSNNLIANVSRADVTQYTKLTSLRLSDNKIVGIYGDIFEGLPMKHIEFQNNEIDYVFDNLSYSKWLAHVDFRNNNCIDVIATKPENIDTLKDKLLFRCSHGPRIKELEGNVSNFEKHDLESDYRITRLENTIQRLKRAMEIKFY